MQLELTNRLSRNETVLWHAGDEGVVLLNPEDGHYYALDEAGGRIWELCDGTRTVSEITAAIVSEYDAPAETVEGDVVGLLAELIDERLVASA